MFLRSLFLDDDANGNGGGGGVQTPVGIDGAIAAAKARLAAGGSVLPEADAGKEQGGESNAGGDGGEKKDGADGAEGGEAGDAGTKKEGGEEGDGGEKKEEQELEEGGETKLVLPALADGEEPIELDGIEDEGLRNRIVGLVERAAQVDQMAIREADISAQRREMEEFQDQLMVDPFVVLLEHTEPEIQSDLVLAILMQNGVWSELKPILMQLDDPAKLAQLQRNLDQRKRDIRPQLEARAKERKIVAASQRVVTSGVATIAAALPKSKQEVFTAQAYRAVQMYNKRTGNNHVTTRDLPILLGEVLSTHGVDPLTAVELLSGKRASGAKRADPPTPKTIARKPTSKEALEAEKQRQAAAAAAAASSVVNNKSPSLLEQAKNSGAKAGDIKGYFAGVRKALGISK